MAKELSLSEYPETGAGPLRAVSNVGAKGDPAGRAETSHLLGQFLMCDCGPVSRRGSTSSDDTGGRSSAVVDTPLRHGGAPFSHVPGDAASCAPDDSGATVISPH